MYEYRFELDRVIDGDTIDVNLDLGFDVILKKQRIRLYGLNTPESRTRDLEEKQYGLAAKARLKDLLEKGETLSLRTAIDKKARGKYGRILGTIFADGVDLNQTLLDEGHAIEYFGGTKNTSKWWLENKKEEKSQNVNWNC
jgi:micrococcal nuclease